MPDIEELDQFLPPCLQELLHDRKNTHFQNTDRLNLVKWLADLKYTESDIMKYLPENQENIHALYYDHLKNKGTDKEGSFRCNSLITLGSKFDSSIKFRCTYERKSNPTNKRRSITKKMQNDFMSQCSCAAPNEYPYTYVFHPLDYIKYQVTSKNDSCKSSNK